MVIGGGQVALGKIEGLLQADARVTVIAPEVNPEIERLAAEGRIVLYQRRYQWGDLQGAFLAIACTDDASINRTVWEEAESCNIPVNVVDQPEFCSFIAPSIVRRGPVAIAISTSGASPALAKRLKEQVSHILPDAIGEFAELLTELRPLAKERIATPEERNLAWQQVVDSDAYQILLTQGKEAARNRIKSILTGETRCIS